MSPVSQRASMPSVSFVVSPDRSLFGWWRDADEKARNAFIAASFGWMLDSFDVMLYAMVIAALVEDPTLHLSLATAGLLTSVTLLAAAAGGIAFGVIADRIGRKRALMLSILTYSICSFAFGLSTSILMLAVFRFILGLGMGGEWNTGATLVAETWPTELRAKAIAIVQSSWAIGYAFAAPNRPGRGCAGRAGATPSGPTDLRPPRRSTRSSPTVPRC